MYPHLMTLEDCERASRSCSASDKSEMFDRVLELAIEFSNELKNINSILYDCNLEVTDLDRTLKDYFLLKEEIVGLEKKVSYLEESIEEQES